jgi:HD-like signal output (HDOD) protein
VLTLKAWGFDNDYIEVARSRKDWLRAPQAKADLADLILN